MKKYLLFIVLLSILILVIERYFAHENAKKIFDWNLVSLDSKISKQIPMIRNLNGTKLQKYISFNFDERQFLCPRKDTVSFSKIDSAAVLKFSDSTYLAIAKGTGFDAYDYISRNLGILIPFLSKKKIYNNNFELFQLIHNYTPNQIGYFDSKYDLNIKYALISMKNIILVNGGDDYLSEFKTENQVKGFQYGNPETNEKTYMLLFQKKYSPLFIINTAFSQSQLDSFIHSID